jgi:hypothetical protein
MLVLPGLGAILKRWPLHQRLKAEGKTLHAEDSLLAFLLFNPVVYLILNMLITATVAIMLMELLFERGSEYGATFGISLFLMGFFCNIFQTILVYRYFSTPKHEPRWQFLRSPQAEMLGDISIFLNMILFQVLYNWLALTSFEHTMGISRFAERLVVWSVIALFIYFPPRIFYLAEDINRPRTWLTILLANLPTMWRILLGTASNPTRSW